MAFSGHIDSDGEIILRDEIYAGRARISSISIHSEQSEQSEQSPHSDQSGLDSRDYISSSRRWEEEGTSSLLYKEQGGSSSSSSAPLSLPPADGTYSRSQGRTNSLYSFSEMYGSLKQIDTISNVVPPLGLSSQTNTLDYMRELDGLKLDREPQVAYETWCASKKRLRQEQLQRQKIERELEKEEHELRKKCAKMCYEKWVRDKAHQAEQRRIDEHIQRAALQASNSVTKNKTNASNRRGRNVTQAEIRQVVQSWWLKKQEQQRRQRQEKEHYLRKKSREEQRRKKLAENAWQNWMSNVYSKPKPVPMNQGIDSLRGTISQIYINPTPWQSLNKSPGSH